MGLLLVRDLLAIALVIMVLALGVLVLVAIRPHDRRRHPR